MLVLAVAEDFDKLLENCGLATIASLGELCGIMIMAINLSVMFVVAVLRSEHRWTYGACEVVDMIFVVERCDV